LLAFTQAALVALATTEEIIATLPDDYITTGGDDYLYLRNINACVEESINFKRVWLILLNYFNPTLSAICTSIFSKLCKNVYSGI
jgi:hypothetical protein